jgi:Arylsulfotransferase (ASST)
MRAPLIAALAVAAAAAGWMWVGGWILPGKERSPRLPPVATVAPALTERLAALDYVTPVLDDPQPKSEGVTLLDASRSEPGVNVYCSVHSTEARFLDAEGRVIRTVALPEAGRGRDCMVVPYRDDRLLALAAPNLTMLDGQSRVLWVSRLDHHHDVSISRSGEIYTLSSHHGAIEHAGTRLKVRDHAVVVLDAEGRVRREIALGPIFARFVTPERLAALLAAKQGPRPSRPELRRLRDVLHANAVAPVEERRGVAEPGNLLVCLRELDLVALVDPERSAVVWSWGPGELEGPHDPTLLENGNVLVFDNGQRRGWSRIVEVDPRTNRIVWQFRADPPGDFFSLIRGSVQALPGGNLLITESTRGRVFEVTRGGATVWEFRNPERREGSAVRKQIYRMSRFPEALAKRLGRAPSGD